MAVIQPKTYLQLCNALIQKAGISGNPLATVNNQSGEMARVVSWIDEAYLDIQEAEPNWDWMQGDVSFPTVAGKAFYSPTEIGLTDYAKWDEQSFRVYFTTPGIRTEVFLEWLEWVDYRDTYQFGNLRLTNGMPIHISMRPEDRSLALGLIPNDVGYTVDGRYFKTVESMTADSDVPLLPARFHMLIVYLAMQYYGAYEAAPEVLGEGKDRYKKMYRRLLADQQTKVQVGSPMC